LAISSPAYFERSGFNCDDHHHRIALFILQYAGHIAAQMVRSGNPPASGPNGRFNQKARFCCKFAAGATTRNHRRNCLLQRAVAQGADAMCLDRAGRLSDAFSEVEREPTLAAPLPHGCPAACVLRVERKDRDFKLMHHRITCRFCQKCIVGRVASELSARQERWAWVDQDNGGRDIGRWDEAARNRPGSKWS
jgi:hypothetical protein